jgi:hypothetical protein
MKSLAIACLLLFAVVMLPGCKTVVSDHMIGVPIEAEQAQAYEGVWRVGDSVMHVKHTDGANLVAAGVEWDDDGFELEQMELIITEHGESRFLQMVAEDEDDDDENGDADDEAEDGDGDGDEGDDDDDDDGDDEAERSWLVVGMMTGTDDQAVVLLPPDFDRFVKALDDGVIEAELDDDGKTLTIHGEKSSLDALVQPERLHELFNMDKPMVITRIGGLD